jgi:hypothetical protein
MKQINEVLKEQIKQQTKAGYCDFMRKIKTNDFCYFFIDVPECVYQGEPEKIGKRHDIYVMARRCYLKRW